MAYSLLHYSTLLLPPLPSSSSSNKTYAAIHVPKLPTVNFSSLPKIPTSTSKSNKLQLQQFKFTETPPLQIDDNKATIQLYAILQAISDRVEMHHNIGQQRDNWNSLLLNSTNMITLAATTMAGIAAAGGDAGVLALKLSSTLLFCAATGILLIINKIQPSQLAEEQRNATRLFKQLETQIENLLAHGNPGEEDVEGAIEKVLALDRAYPLPLLGVMLEKFPAKFEPAGWWPSHNKKDIQNKIEGSMNNNNNNNGWSEELEREVREVIEVTKRKDMEEYQRLGNLALKVNKVLAISGPTLTGIAAIGSALVGRGSMVDIVPLVAGSLAAVVNAVEHGGQVGMVVEMYRNCGGFFNMLEASVESNLREKDSEVRENGELFEMKMALRLGRSVSQLRQLASKSRQGLSIDEFASKLF